MVTCAMEFHNSLWAMQLGSARPGDFLLETLPTQRRKLPELQPRRASVTSVEIGKRSELTIFSPTRISTSGQPV